MSRILLMLAVSVTLVAQQGPSAGAQQGPVASVPPGKVALEGRIIAQLFQMRTARIQQTLGLPEDRARVLAERWGRWDRDFIERARQMVQMRGQFNQVLMTSASEDEKCNRLKPLVDQFLALRTQQEEGKRRFEADMLQSLTPAQQARMILLVEEIQGRIRDFLHESRKGGKF